MAHDPIADAFRRWGHLQAEIDPLRRLPLLSHPELDAVPPDVAARLRAIYCGPLAAEFMHLPQSDRVHWIAERMERPAAIPERRRILERIAAAEVFERFTHQRYVGTKRYSLEGAAALIPLLDAILDAAGAAGAEVVLLAMSHRGRLNVMAHVVGVPYEHLFAKFEDVDPRSFLGGGDVKYHLGATGKYTTASGRALQVHLASNPSHLEAVDPVAIGRARARQTRLGAAGRARVVPILLHGDAAFAGQGIAAETLNFSTLPGFDVGGAIHVVIDNRIGFTTPPGALHSSRYATDVAKRLDVPVLHVNGEEPEVVDRAGRMAADYRAEFATDVVIDLLGYRRYGHSEVDDPTMTQPLLYREIERRPVLWRAYAQRLGVPDTEADAREAGLRERLDAAQRAAQELKDAPRLGTPPPYWNGYAGGRWDPAAEIDSGVEASRLEGIARRLAATPPGLRVHPKVRRGLDERLEMAAGRRPVDWGCAEALAFGSLLEAGTPVRLTGQDTRRGTFGQRHAVLIDVEDEREHVPLAHLDPAQAGFEVRDTVLSEAAALGFEYGYSRDYPEALVCWEAQFGDFVNGAQVIVDQFVSAGEDKWGLLSGLVLLLPHGYEGQGPEHSSARLERFLQLCGEDNIQVCQPTTAAQYFHLLRRQALRRWRKPLVALTPKSLLRAPAAGSPIAELARGRFRTVLDDPHHAGAARLLLCGGRVAYDLLAERARRAAEDVAIVRVEQYHPWPAADLAAALSGHASAREVVWVQEEPANMGALSWILPRLEPLVSGRPLTSVKRSASASPATGSAKAHAIEQRTLVELAFARSAS